MLGSQRLPATVIYCAFEFAGDQRGDAVVQPQSADFFPASVMQILPATTSKEGRQLA